MIKREECDRVRSENAAKRRNKSMPKAYRRMARITAAEADAGAEDAADGEDSRGGTDQELKSSITPAIDTSASPDAVATPEDGSKAKVGAVTEKAQVRMTASACWAELTEANLQGTLEGDDVWSTKQQRQPKACTGLKPLIDEGITLAFDDDRDVATINAANRKAWPRGRSRVGTSATVEDRELAELVRIGLLTPEELVVDHWDDIGEFCPYTVRFGDPKRKGAGTTCKGFPDCGADVPPPASIEEHEVDWTCLGDEAYAQLLQDGWLDSNDGSELSYVFIDT